MLKRVVDVVEMVALAAAGVFVVLLFALGPEDDEPSSAAPSAPGAVDGAAIFSSDCASCHGDDGEGGFGPRLGGGAVVEQFPDVEDQIEVVTDGRGGMPSFDNRLTTEEIRAVVVYTREGL